MHVPPGVHLIGFADNQAVVGVAKSGELLKDLVNPVFESIYRWMTSRGLQLAHHKTEAVMITKRWAYNYTSPQHRVLTNGLPQKSMSSIRKPSLTLGFPSGNIC